MKRRAICADLLLCAGCAGFYGLNRFWLRRVTGGWARWFLVCYANDLFAGLFLAAWTDALFRLAGLPPIRSWRQTVPLLLACGLVWEGLAPFWKAGAVFDPWDFLAYQAGGLAYLLVCRTADRILKRSS